MEMMNMSTYLTTKMEMIRLGESDEEHLISLRHLLKVTLRC